jgi:hypothetical protein
MPDTPAPMIATRKVGHLSSIGAGSSRSEHLRVAIGENSDNEFRRPALPLFGGRLWIDDAECGAASRESHAVQNHSMAIARTGIRRIRLGGLIALASLVVYVLVGLPFIVIPKVGPKPKHADVAFVLGPLSEKRIALAKRLLADHTVDHMMWSATITTHSQYPLLQECRTTPGLVCERPSPATTEGEGQMLQRQAEANGWTSVIVITQTAHITRARSIVSRCFSGRITMLESGDPPLFGWPYEYLYQTAATVKLWFDPPC